MKRALAVVLAGLAMVLMIVLGQIAELWDADLAADEDARASVSLPSWWPLGAAVVIVAVIASSAVWPWGFAR